MSAHTATEALEVVRGDRQWALIPGDCRQVLAHLPDGCAHHVITDPPYSEHVHSKQRRGNTLPDALGGHRASISRVRELGFAALDDATRDEVARQAARLVKGWFLAFHNHEMTGDWLKSIQAAGLQHIRCGVWVKTGSTPQFSGDRPASGSEAIEIAHPKGRKRWNGGGSHAVWTTPIEFNRGGGNPRLHTTQKPLALMLELVADFTVPDDVVIDPFAGSGTTGVACLRLGRRFIGVELDPAHAATARERLAAESQGLTLRDARAGQMSLLAAGGSR